MPKEIEYFRVVITSIPELEKTLNGLRNEGYNIVQVIPTFKNDKDLNVEVAIVTILSPHNPKFLELVKAETEPKEPKNE